MAAAADCGAVTMHVMAMPCDSTTVVVHVSRTDVVRMPLMVSPLELPISSRSQPSLVGLMQAWWWEIC
jgi:hypothetical protein